MGRGQNVMGRGSDISWIGGLIYHELGLKIPWVGGKYTMIKGVKIPWIGGPIYQCYRALPWVGGHKNQG